MLMLILKTVAQQYYHSQIVLVDAVITAGVQDKDIIFKGDDGGSAITSLTLDMSNSGEICIFCLLTTQKQL